MDSSEPLKMFEKGKKGLIISVLLFVLGIIFIILGSYLMNEKKDVVAKDYNYLISYNKDKSNEYVKLTITYLPYLFAEESGSYGNKKYYIVFDENDYPYIARLTDSTYKGLEIKYDKGEKISYELSGYLLKQEDKLKKLAIDAHREIFDDSKINESNYSSYFGNTYLDETYVPPTALSIISMVLGFILTPVCFVFIIFNIVSIIKTKKTIKKYGIEELKYQLLKSNSIFYKKQNICLTDKYLVTCFTGLNVINYEDILWLYYQNVSYNYVPVGKYLVAATVNKKRIRIAYSYKNAELLVEIMNKIQEKNNQIMLGFTKENQKKYKELIKK